MELRGVAHFRAYFVEHVVSSSALMWGRHVARMRIYRVLRVENRLVAERKSNGKMKRVKFRYRSDFYSFEFVVALISETRMN